MSLFDGAAPIATASVEITDDSTRFFESDLPFDRVVLDLSSNWVVPEIVVEAPSPVPATDALGRALLGALLGGAALATLARARRRASRPAEGGGASR